MTLQTTPSVFTLFMLLGFYYIWLLQSFVICEVFLSPHNPNCVYLNDLT